VIRSNRRRRTIAVAALVAIAALYIVPGALDALAQGSPFGMPRPSQPAPPPPDGIVGFVTRGHGVSVHRTTCVNVGALRSDEGRMVEVEWAPSASSVFLVNIQVEALDRTRLLSDVATVLSDNHVNILSATSATGKDRITRLRFTFELADIAHLSSVLASVKRVESVYDAYRVVPS